MMYRGFGGYGYHTLGPGHGWLVGLVFCLLFIAAIVMLVMMLVRMARRGTMGGHMGHMGGHHWMMGTGPEDPIAIVKRRLASGEITSEQYEEIMSKLRV